MRQLPLSTEPIGAARIDERPRENRMKVSVDNSVCEAHGQCNLAYPELFTVDDDGYSNIGTGREVPPGAEERAGAAVDSCPVRALSVDP